ncbi:LacI family transcriptional regulator [Enterobacterales bacterium CwR94]|nr:LacI family transcriptional regulator [Enterobacterales bacterium CwR94]
MADSSRRPVTSYDVAKLAGVSQSAVSRAFTEGAKIADSTREKVHQAAATLGYRPSFIARSLITRRSNLIGVVVPGLVNPFYAALLDALSHALNQMGYRVLLFSMLQDDDTDPILEEVLRHRVEAVVMVSSSLSSHFSYECQRSGLPVLLLNRTNDSATVSSITSDNVGGGAAIADFLLAGGHQQLAFIAGRDSSSTSRDRETGFVQRLAQRGAAPIMRETGDWSLMGAMAATRRLMASSSPPDAVFCANDMMAIGALNVIVGEMGCLAGRDISIVGFDDIAMGAWPLFNLTTWQQPLTEMVASAIAILRAQLAQQDCAPVQCQLPGKLILRGSARIPAILPDFSDDPLPPYRA